MPIIRCLYGSCISSQARLYKLGQAGAYKESLISAPGMMHCSTLDSRQVALA